MNSRISAGRAAGLWYLLLIVLGPLRLIYIPSKLIVHDNPALTASNIAAHETLFRLGMAGDVLAAVVLVMMTMAFWGLFEGVDRNLAWLVVIFGGVMPGLLYLVNVVNDAAALRLFLHDAAFMSAFDSAQQQAMGTLFLDLHRWLVSAAEILWGVWLFPLGALIWRSRYIPRFIGVWVALAGVCYVALSLAAFLAPGYEETIFKLSQPFTLGEIAVMVALLIKGPRGTVTNG
jgi:hypothetical protein